MKNVLFSCNGFNKDFFNEVNNDAELLNDIKFLENKSVVYSPYWKKINTLMDGTKIIDWGYNLSSLFNPELRFSN